MTDAIAKVRGIMDAAEDIDLPEGVGTGEPDTDHDDPLYGDEDGYSPNLDEAPPLPPSDDPLPEADCADFPLNDYGNGQRFIRHFGQDVLNEPKLGFHVWTGTHFELDKHQILVRRRAQQLGELIAQEIPYLRLEDWQMDAIGREAILRDDLAKISTEVGDDGKLPDDKQAAADGLRQKLTSIVTLKKSLGDKRKAHRNFARSSGNKGKIDAALTEAAVHIDVRFEDLDANAYEVNCQSGLLRFSTQTDGSGKKQASVELAPHDRAHMVTRLIPASYDPREPKPYPVFAAFLERIQPSAEMRFFLQRWFGLSMSGIPVQALSFFYGAGANGKSVLVDIIAKILDSYASDMRIETLTGRNSNDGSKPTPDLVFLVNARMARASEPKEGEELQDALIKQLTSGEPINVRPNYGEFFKFYPKFKLTISGNHKPKMTSTDDGIWRRINLVPFDVQIPEAERDANLIDKLWEERDGILSWLVEGLLEFLEVGLKVPEQIRDATLEYREDSDPIGSFITDCCECTGNPSDRIPSRDLVLAFNYWVDQRGEGKWTERRISSRLKEKAGRWKSPRNGLGFQNIKSSGLMTYTGIRFTAEFGDKFQKAPRDQEGRPLHGRAAWDV